jgi:hypothetical protein
MRTAEWGAVLTTALAGLFAASPKTYELRLPTFLLRIATFQDGYRYVAGLWAARSVAPWNPFAHSGIAFQLRLQST